MITLVQLFKQTQSAGHRFDVIVTADDVNKLNENARACLHEGDTYFANSKLESWQLKYCLDNDAKLDLLGQIVSMAKASFIG